MWIADKWQDYELLDCGGGEKLERWDKQFLVRPDPQAIWECEHKNPAWKRANARYHRSQSGGGHWEKKALPDSTKTSSQANICYRIVSLIICILDIVELVVFFLELFFVPFSFTFLDLFVAVTSK